ncbi:MAG: hypothetical protein LBM98_08110 [Oscillospiraceae bacterium]|jgi:hypothetical protein|nr:hypothetical protein [Oscillospiraceae bacterium]
MQSLTTTNAPISAARLTANPGANREIIISALKMFRAAYPAHAGKFSTKEACEAHIALWSEVFAGVEPEVLREAVVIFIANNKTSFWPSPGQIGVEVKKLLRKSNGAAQAFSELQRLDRILENMEKVKTCETCDLASKKLERDWKTREFIEHIICDAPRSEQFTKKVAAGFDCREYYKQEAFIPETPQLLLGGAE